MQLSSGGKSIQSVQRAIDIINCFDEKNIELSLNEISTILNLNKSTIHGILNTLRNNGYICQNKEGRYMLGQSLLNKYRFSNITNKVLLTVTAKPHMNSLSHKFKANVSLFAMDEGRLMLQHRSFPENSAYSINSVSDNDPMYCTASGKLSLSNFSKNILKNYLDNTELVPLTPYTITSKETLIKELEEIHKRGYSYENQELGEGVSAVSVPIYSNHNKLFGSISITGVTSHILRNIDSIVNDLKSASSSITKEMNL